MCLTTNWVQGDEQMKTAKEWNDIYLHFSKKAISDNCFTLCFERGITEVVKQAKQEVFDDISKELYQSNNTYGQLLKDYEKIKSKHLHPIIDKDSKASLS